MRFTKDVAGQVAADVGPRSGPQTPEITTVVVEPSRGPPETNRMCVIVDLLTRIKIIRLEQRFRALELLVRKVVGIIEVGNLVVDRARHRLCFIRSCLRNEIDRADVSLRVVAEADVGRQSGVDQRTLKTRIRLPENERKNIRSVGGCVVLAD